MNYLYLTHLLNGILMLLLPVGLGVYLSRRYQFGWRLWWIGAGTFLLSQIGHIPFNILVSILFQREVLPTPPENIQLVFNALFLGLSAGLGVHLSRFRVIVQLPGTAARVSAARFAELAGQSRSLRNVIINFNDLLLAQVQHPVACNALHVVESRLCRWLMHTRDCTGSDILPLTQEFLSQGSGRVAEA